MSITYRLGLDIGSNSIGWCALRLSPNGEIAGLLDAGALVYSDGRDPQTKSSLASERREKRGARRNRDRATLRKADLVQALVETGLMPRDESERKALERLDPYDLRKRGLKKALHPHELGRALFHLHQNRGFKSNRKTDNPDDKGKIATASTNLAQAIKDGEFCTLGEYLAGRHERREGVRARLRGIGSKAQYDLYPTRDMVEAEFGKLWAAQRHHRPDLLTEAARARIYEVMFRQRPLKAVPVGRCLFNPDERRVPWSDPLAQRFRILQELNNLRVRTPGMGERRLDREERDLVFDELLKKNTMTFKAMRKLLRLDDDVTFNLEGAIFELPDGTWEGRSLSRFDAARGEEPIAPDGARHLMRLYKNDLVSVEIDGQRQAMRVYALEPSAKRVRLAPHHIAGNPDQRHADPEDPFVRFLASYGKLRAWQAMPLHVDRLGRVFRRKV